MVMKGSSAFQIIRPFAWLAAFAFMVGFVSYLALGRPSQAIAQEAPAPNFSDTASWPASEEWNVAKQI